jgi:hypothetical protein
MQQPAVGQAMIGLQYFFLYNGRRTIDFPQQEQYSTPASGFSK